MVTIDRGMKDQIRLIHVIEKDITRNACDSIQTYKIFVRYLKDNHHILIMGVKKHTFLIH
ncbi:protein of unknown function [Candidatus Nitrosocosmicus franklandus]|uniref:Uncharacterized protein n=1 Tax=Candidatus Nitrosocosmicus franklandianus TaxID=1798806 RepID=A0A484I760_9ARCH|nr:protein of unknown function [Candidatus Nitrosocosmicus franklandus]